jgi:hypothetical protein
VQQTLPFSCPLAATKRSKRRQAPAQSEARTEKRAIWVNSTIADGDFNVNGHFSDDPDTKRDGDGGPSGSLWASTHSESEKPSFSRPERRCIRDGAAIVRPDIKQPLRLRNMTMAARDLVLLAERTQLALTRRTGLNRTRQLRFKKELLPKERRGGGVAIRVRGVDR